MSDGSVVFGQRATGASGVATPVAELETSLPRPDHPDVTDLIAERARAAPDRVAISVGEHTVRYGTLVRRGEAVAVALARAGYGPGDIVAVSGLRGAGFVVALYGVRRSGAAVRALGAGRPPRRYRQLATSGDPAALVLVEPSPDAAGNAGVGAGGVEAGGVEAGGVGREVGARGTAVPALRLDAGGQVLTPGLPTRSAADAPRLPAATAGRVPAYLFFTSGTTGTPKGVLGWHGALSHFLLWQRDTFAIGELDRCAQLTSASFDVMLRDTFLALVSGGTLVIPRPRDELGGAAVLDWLARERITVLHAVPTVLRNWLLDAPSGMNLPALRRVFLAGEPLKSTVVEALRAVTDDRAWIVNLYGPTETTLAKFAYRVPDGPLPPLLPVGSPLPSCQAVLVRDGVPCAPDEPGEILIRTPYRAIGYLDDPGATAAAYLANPYRQDPDDLLYRTGDLGRWLPGGLLEVSGRVDHQVKVNGVRVQPAEVETVLCRHPLVATCLVAAHHDRHEQTHLVAYVVAPAAGADLGQQLRRYLSDRLPQAMVPSEFLRLAAIPTTPNGKPDRAALPVPTFARIPGDGPAAVPTTPTERVLGDLWADVLDHPAPGAHDDFFALGGTSLTLMRLFTRIEERYPGAVRVAQLFAHPTIATQAALVDPQSIVVKQKVMEHEL